MRAAGVSEKALVDAIHIAALFNMIVRLADSLGGTSRSSTPSMGARTRCWPETTSSSSGYDQPVIADIWFYLLPLYILGALLLLVGIFALLSRIKGGKYLKPIVNGMMKVPLLNRMSKRASQAALERQNPELASAVKSSSAQVWRGIRQRRSRLCRG